MTVPELQRRYLAGEFVVTQDEAEPWRIVKTSRSAWYRFMASDDAPAGLVLKLGRKRLLSLPVFLGWIGGLPEREGAHRHIDAAHVAEALVPAGTKPQTENQARTMFDRLDPEADAA